MNEPSRIPDRSTLIRKLYFPYQCSGFDVISSAVVVSSKLLCYTNDDQLYDLLWLASKQKFFLLATSTTSWSLPIARHPLRNRVIVLLAAKAGLRAVEIANLTWDMVLDPTGEIGSSIEAARHRRQERQRPTDPGTPRSSARPRRLS
jgi:integrase